MAEVAAHLVDNILPETPYRQFVLSVPIPLRYWMATNRKLTSKVHKIFAEEVEALYQRKAESRDLQTVGSGSINFIQIFGGAINLNIHFHLLQMNGVYVRRRSKLVFKKLGVPSTAELSTLLTRVHYRVATLVQRLGYLKEGSQPEGLFDDDQLYAATLHASTQLRIATGPVVAGGCDSSRVAPSRSRLQIREQRLSETPSSKLSARSSWAKLLARVFAIDVSVCSRCGGEVKIVGTIFDQLVASKILTHLGMSPQPPPVASAQEWGVD